MIYRALTRIETPSGPAFVQPDEVVSILKQPNGSLLFLAGSRQVVATETAEVIANRLWRFTNELGNAFFNERHIQIIESRGSRSLITLTGGLQFDSDLPADQWPEAIRMINERRNLNVGDL